MIFFNNHLIDSQYVAIEKKKSTMVRQPHHPEQNRRNDFFWVGCGLPTEVVG
jgi:hypothetical protein